MKTVQEKPPLVCPMVIVVDSNESAPYRFTGIRSDKSDDAEQRPWIVNTVTKALWAMHKAPVEINGQLFEKGLADYSISGMEERVSIERKSQKDLVTTLSQRRDEFQAEMVRLESCEFSAVVVEADWHQLLFNMPPSSLLQPKTISRTILSWSIRYRTKWFLCMNRRHAEIVTFHLLKRFWDLNGIGA